MTNTAPKPAFIPESAAERLARTISHGDTTVDEMATELGVHPNTVLNYISGRTKPRRSVYAAWALKTGRSRDWLEHGVVASGPNEGEAVTIRKPRPVADLAAHRQARDGIPPGQSVALAS